nr:interleukin-5 receptor subunit alpha-like isoform X2 [Misgurnus anguillicaudatus]
MIFKERIPRVACFTFIFIFGLIFTWSFTLADDTALHGFNAEKMTCILDIKNNLSCNWNISGLPKNAAYSAYETQDNLNQHLYCSHIVEKETLECHGPIDVTHPQTVIIKVNISLPTLWYITTTGFLSRRIVKLPPPLNISSAISNHRKNLEINWTHGKELSTNEECYKHELQINDEVVPLPDGVSSFIKQDVDLTRKYSIKVRVQLTEGCSGGVYWSDWSTVHEVGPFENKYSVNPWVITVIVLILPMFLLAILLLCKFQRLPKKLFPPIPGPSVNVKNLLEKEHDFQDFSGKHVEHETEVVYADEERDC